MWPTFSLDKSDFKKINKATSHSYLMYIKMMC